MQSCRARQCALIASESLFEREEISRSGAEVVRARRGGTQGSKDLVPPIRWPLLPVTLRLGLAGEQLLMHLMDQTALVACSVPRC